MRYWPQQTDIYLCMLYFLKFDVIVFSMTVLKPKLGRWEIDELTNCLQSGDNASAMFLYIFMLNVKSYSKNIGLSTNKCDSCSCFNFLQSVHDLMTSPRQSYWEHSVLYTSTHTGLSAKVHPEEQQYFITHWKYPKCFNS